jgi:hypothetical protein
MGVVIVFNYTAWQGQFPELAAVSQNDAQGFFNEATMFCRNDGGGPVSNAMMQTQLLYMLTAHIASLRRQGQGAPSPGSPIVPNSPVGRINNASEGSVSIQTDYGTGVTTKQAWYLQTKYGAEYWEMSAPYRTMRYRPGVAQPAFGSYGPYGRWPGRF